MSMNVDLEPIGVVHSSISSNEAEKIPLHGVPAEIEVFNKYLDALDGIETKSHIFVLCWLHKADRDILKVKPCKRFFPSGVIPEWVAARGVFATRSPARPNPISLTVTKLIKRDGNRLKVILDVVDGTPVIDLKPYSTGWDCIFSAHGGEGRFSNNVTCYTSLRKEAVNFHGEECAGLAMGVRIALKAITGLKINLREQRVKLCVRGGGCLIDTMQALSGATLGNSRLSIETNDGSGEFVAVVLKDWSFRFSIKPYSHLTPAQIASTDPEQLFTLTEAVNVDLSQQLPSHQVSSETARCR
jgi:tRNA-Thr(GGU) m(6)t(6)A37 methyltransferase TsaA